MRPAGEVDFDEALAGARQGGEASWAILYDLLAPQVLGYLPSPPRAADAEEVLGDVFLHVARGIDDFEGDCSGFRSWVFVIATSRLMDERRRIRRKPTDVLDAAVEEQLSATIDIESEVEQAAAAEEAQTLLAALTPDQRAVVELRIFGELTSAEVAVIVDKPQGAVKALYRRGLAALRRELYSVEPCQSDDRLLPLPSMANVPAVPLRLSAAVTEGP